MSYYRTIKLEHHQIPAILDKETGEVKPLEKVERENGMVNFKLMPTYQRTNVKAWQLLETQTTKLEYFVAHQMALMAKAYTNSLIPLNDETTLLELAETVKVDRNVVKKCIDKLFKLGVIGKFEVYEHNEQHMKYWVFNPYLSFNGNTIKKNVVTLFDGTTYALISPRN